MAWLTIAFVQGIATASTWTVNTTSDHTVDFSLCTSNDCTLREGITIASSGDVIEFAPSVTGTITLDGAGELFIQQNITINGPGANLLAVNGANATRICEIKAGSTVHISGPMITNGFVNTPTPVFGEAMGGGILNSGTLYLMVCALTTTRTDGGAVFLLNSLIVSNTADQAPDAFGSFSTPGHNLVGIVRVAHRGTSRQAGDDRHRRRAGLLPAISQMLCANALSGTRSFASASKIVGPGS